MEMVGLWLIFLILCAVIYRIEKAVGALRAAVVTAAEAQAARDEHARKQRQFALEYLYAIATGKPASTNKEARPEP